MVSQNESGEWTATSADVPGLLVRAETREVAIEKMKKALSLYFPCGECREND